MAQFSEKDQSTVTRRMASLAKHFVSGTSSSSNGSVGFLPTSMNDSYHRIHGEVPTHIPVWKQVTDSSGKEFVDIIYEKAEGEGIAKVRASMLQCLKM